MSRYKIKEKPPTHWICDRKKDCAGSDICGNKCKHTQDFSHAAYKGHPKFRRANDGSQWETSQPWLDKELFGKE